MHCLVQGILEPKYILVREDKIYDIHIVEDRIADICMYIHSCYIYSDISLSPDIDLKP